MREIKKTMSENYRHHHNHHRRIEKTRLKTLASQKRKKIIANISFTALCVIASAIIIFVIWLYMPGA